MANFKSLLNGVSMHGNWPLDVLIANIEGQQLLEGSTGINAILALARTQILDVWGSSDINTYLVSNTTFLNQHHTPKFNS